MIKEKYEDENSETTQDESFGSHLCLKQMMQKPSASLSKKEMRIIVDTRFIKSTSRFQLTLYYEKDRFKSVMNDSLNAADERKKAESIKRL